MKRAHELREWVTMHHRSWNRTGRPPEYDELVRRLYVEYTRGALRSPSGAAQEKVVTETLPRLASAVRIDNLLSARMPPLMWIPPGRDAFVFVAGRRSPNWNDGDLVRFYFHSRHRDIEALMRLLVVRLDSFWIPFQLKFLRDGNPTGRADAVVLFALRRDVRSICGLVGDVWDAVLPRLLEATPRLTLQLAPGLGFAESPFSSESFGMARCATLATALMACARSRLLSSARWYAHVVTAFRTAGVNPDRPHLGPGISYDYDFGPFMSREPS